MPARDVRNSILPTHTKKSQNFPRVEPTEKVHSRSVTAREEQKDTLRPPGKAAPRQTN